MQQNGARMENINAPENAGYSVNRLDDEHGTEDGGGNRAYPASGHAIPIEACTLQRRFQSEFRQEVISKLRSEPSPAIRF
jgi:hypothetical protein